MCDVGYDLFFIFVIREVNGVRLSPPGAANGGEKERRFFTSNTTANEKLLSKLEQLQK